MPHKSYSGSKGKGKATAGPSTTSASAQANSVPPVTTISYERYAKIGPTIIQKTGGVDIISGRSSQIPMVKAAIQVGSSDALIRLVLDQSTQFASIMCLEPTGGNRGIIFYGPDFCFINRGNLEERQMPSELLPCLKPHFRAGKFLAVWVKCTLSKMQAGANPVSIGYTLTETDFRVPAPNATPLLEVIRELDTEEDRVQVVTLQVLYPLNSHDDKGNIKLNLNPINGMWDQMAAVMDLNSAFGIWWYVTAHETFTDDQGKRINDWLVKNLPEAITGVFAPPQWLVPKEYRDDAGRPKMWSSFKSQTVIRDMSMYTNTFLVGLLRKFASTTTATASELATAQSYMQAQWKTLLFMENGYTCQPGRALDLSRILLNQRPADDRLHMFDISAGLNDECKNDLQKRLVFVSKNLDKTELAAINMVMKCPGAFSILDVSPQSDRKSTTITSILRIIHASRRKTLVTARADSAIDLLARTCAQLPATKNLRMCRFRTGMLMTSQVLKNMDIVFCILNMSGDKALVESFRPQALVIDQADRAVEPEVLVPMAAYHNDLELMVVIGCSESEPLELAGAGRTEVHEQMCLSPFARWLKLGYNPSVKL